jgi:hypothetical protein
MFWINKYDFRITKKRIIGILDREILDREILDREIFWYAVNLRCP